MAFWNGIFHIISVSSYIFGINTAVQYRSIGKMRKSTLKMTCNCHVQGVGRDLRNPVRTRVTPLDSSDALYIVYLGYTVKPLRNSVSLQAVCQWIKLAIW